MRIVVGQRETTWTTTPEHAAAVEAEIRALGSAFVRAEGTYVWADGDMPVLTYTFAHGIVVGPVFDAFDRLRAAGVWLYGSYREISPFS